jgi:hypothetical protein
LAPKKNVCGVSGRTCGWGTYHEAHAGLVRRGEDVLQDQEGVVRVVAAWTVSGILGGSAYLNPRLTTSRRRE